jgi:hypothetical protein
MVYQTPQKDRANTDTLVIPVDHYLVVREDGRIERLCEHGCGHPIGHVRRWAKWMGIHGCDGCCRQWTDEGD